MEAEKENGNNGIKEVDGLRDSHNDEGLRASEIRKISRGLQDHRCKTTQEIRTTNPRRL